MGSRVSTASRKAWWPLVLYGLPLGLRSRSVRALQLGQRPVPLCRLGQPGVEHERMVSCLRGWLRVWCLLVRLTLGREVCALRSRVACPAPHAVGLGSYAGE